MGSNVKTAAGLQRIASLVVIAMVLILKNNRASAFSAITRSNSSGLLNCSGSMQECLIINDANLVFFADQKATTSKPGEVSKGTKNQGEPAIGCGKGAPYTPCVPGKNPQPLIGEHYIYQGTNRGCPK